MPLRRRGGFDTDDDGRIDIKKGGALPIANLARLHAIASGITISGTMDRLVAVEALGRLEPEAATGLREAFTVVSRIRIVHHAACLSSGRPLDNRVDPGELPPLERATLREAFHEVATQQKKLSVFVPVGM